jgi:hypothetical protein
MPASVSRVAITWAGIQSVGLDRFAVARDDVDHGTVIASPSAGEAIQSRPWTSPIWDDDSFRVMPASVSRFAITWAGIQSVGLDRFAVARDDVEHGTVIASPSAGEAIQSRPLDPAYTG